MKIKKLVPIITMLLIILIAGCKKDSQKNEQPKVTSTGPLDKATNIAINSKITAVFNVEMNPSTLTSAQFTLRQGTTTVPGTIECMGTSTSFNPAANLSANTLYTATISTGAKNNSGQGLESDYTWSFTTSAVADAVAPAVTLTSPLNNATSVAFNQAIVFTFSEPMNPTTINATTFNLKQGTSVVAGTFTYSLTSATFTPSANLEPAKIYTGTITTGAKDLAGNALAVNTVVSFTTKDASSSALSVVDLGAAANYVILAKTAITNNGSSAVTGDLGLSPAATSYITGFTLTNATGFATSILVTGKLYAADMAAPTPINLTTAVNNLITAYNDAAGRTTPDYLELGTGIIGGKTLTPGLYKWTNNVTMASDVTISGGANDVWIFQIAGNLTMSSAVKINLTGGAQAKNIFWQVAGQATLGTTSHFEGILMSKTGITLQTGASIKGRALAQTAVILDGNAVTKPF